jgi:cellulose synthase/poly-beta-1,6-N-acetylglucosamine synthase-like glycosyltransferase
MPTGTNAILRSNALKELGGLKYGALTEDLHSSMCLAAKWGWRGRYVAEQLAVGLAPPNLHESKYCYNLLYTSVVYKLYTVTSLCISLACTSCTSLILIRACYSFSVTLCNSSMQQAHGTC